MANYLHSYLQWLDLTHCTRVYYYYLGLDLSIYMATGMLWMTLCIDIVYDI